MYRFFALRKHWSDWLTTHKIALAAARNLGDRHTAATMLNRLDNAARVSPTRRRGHLLRGAFEIFAEIGDERGQGQNLANLDVVFTKLGRLDAALDQCGRALLL
jgi:hypothetical protein